MSAGEKKAQKKELAIAALLQAESIREAAIKAGIAEATLHRWLKETSFQEDYRIAKREVVSHAICRLQRSAGKAVATLLEIAEAKDNPASARVSAAKTILEMSLKAVEFEDFEKRIADIEKKIAEGKK
ncbi:MAG: hypothetical protein ABFD50_08390 [Smithella sp.]